MGRPLFFLLPFLLRCEATGENRGRQNKLETEQAVPSPSPAKVAAVAYTGQRAFFRREEAYEHNTPVPTPSPPATCDDCPCNDATHVRRFGWQNAVCSNTTCGSCTVDGVDQCCEPRQSCEHYKCPDHSLGRKEAGEGVQFLCIAAACGFKEDADLCCKMKARCDTMECPERHINKVNEAELDCVTNPCDPNSTRDQATCCERKATCASYMFSGDSVCPSDHRVEVSAGHTVEVRMVLRPNAGMIDCQHKTCDATSDMDVCCEERSKCPNMNCGKHHVGYALRFDASQLWCVGRHCDAVDLETCCYDAADAAVVREQETALLNSVTVSPTPEPAPTPPPPPPPETP